MNVNYCTFIHTVDATHLPDIFVSSDTYGHEFFANWFVPNRNTNISDSGFHPKMYIPKPVRKNNNFVPEPIRDVPCQL